LGAAAFFGVGIGQLERAELGCQAKNQPVFQRFAEAPRRISADGPWPVHSRADLLGVPLLFEPNPELGIMQSIFRSASRRDTLGRHSKGGRRSGGLKIDWTKPPPRAWPMGRAEAALTLMPARFDTTYIGVYENLNIVIDVHPA
jgi:hypothetical protein